MYTQDILLAVIKTDTMHELEKITEKINRQIFDEVLFFCSTAITDLCLFQVSGPLLESRTAILVLDPCIPYKVEVRCRRLAGSGYWSDWSDASVSSVYDFKGKPLI